jgi:hypothetical protein
MKLFYNNIQGPGQKEKALNNHMYDLAVEVSQSVEQSNAGYGNKFGRPADAKSSAPSQSDAKGDMKEWMMDGGDNKMDRRNLLRDDMTKSQSLTNNRFDEALEFSQSGSEESVETTPKPQETNNNNNQQQQQQLRPGVNANNNANKGAAGGGSNLQSQQQSQQQQSQQQQQQQQPQYQLQPQNLSQQPSKQSRTQISPDVSY